MSIYREILSPTMKLEDSSQNQESDGKTVRHGRFEDLKICSIFGNCVFPLNFHDRKSGEIMVFYAVSSVAIFHIEIRPSGRSSRNNKNKRGPNNNPLATLDRISF